MAEGQPLDIDQGLPSRVRESLEAWPEPRVAKTGVTLIVVLGVADLLVGPTFSLLSLYAAPVALVAWLARPGVAYAMAAMAAFALTGVPLLAGRADDPWLVLWNLASVAVLLSTVAGLTTMASSDRFSKSQSSSVPS